MHGVIAAIAPNDSEERFTGLGVKVIRAAARFTGPREVEADGYTVRARRFVVATGSAPRIPPIEGLDSVPYLTNETVFDEKTLPEHLIVIGGGPIGVELAQAFRRLGARVTVLEMASILPKDDPELAEFVRRRLRRDGVDLREGIEVRRVERHGNGVAAITAAEDGERRIEGSTLLVATGRAPTVRNLGLEEAGVAYSDGGIEVDSRLRTTNRRIYAIGDVVGGLQFTHVAGYHAGIVIRNALFRLPAKVDYRAVPWVTYTDPEFAHVGMTEAAARAAHDKIRILRWPVADNDRAQAERRPEGLVKVVTTARGRILGAGIVAPHGGELIQPWVLAIGKGLKIADMAQFVAPYPTLGELSKRAAGSYFAPKLFGERTRRVVRFLARFGAEAELRKSSPDHGFFTKN